MKVAIRADASQLIGSGHVMRCRALTKELQRRGIEVLFLCRKLPGDLIAVLCDDRIAVAELPPVTDYMNSDKNLQYSSWLGVSEDTDATQSLRALDEFDADWLIIDHYGIGIHWEERLKSKANFIFAIDDLGRSHLCDALLDQNWFGTISKNRYIGKVREDCRQFLGPRYALLHPAFAQARMGLPPRQGRLRRILVFFGGVDPLGLTAQALDALRSPSLLDLDVDVVIGGANPHWKTIMQLVAERPRTTLYRGLPHLANLMERADLMLGAGGTTTWERCCLGLPAIVVSSGDNQHEYTKLLAQENIQFGLGRADCVKENDWREMLEYLRANPDRLSQASINAMQLCDGFGARRIADMMEGKSICPVIRRATPKDKQLLFQWVNDTDVRMNSLSKTPIDLSTHELWFSTKLADPNCIILIAENSYGLPIGQARCECYQGEGRLDVSVDASVRGCGIGKYLIQTIVTEIRNSVLCRQIIAEVLFTNRPSYRLFESAGFTPTISENIPNGTVRFVLQISP